MSGFIEIVCRDKNKHLINIKYIEEIAETSDENVCLIYLTSRNDEYWEIRESYETVKNKISDATIQCVYAQIDR